MKNLISAMVLGLMLSTQSLSVLAASLGTDQAPGSDLVRGVGNGKFWIVQEELEWIIGHTNEKIVVPKGFVTDYASIPKDLWNKGLEPHGFYNRAAIIHDYLYWSQGCTRDQADRLMVIAMKESNVGTIDGFTIYTGLKIGGRIAWNSNAKERAEGKPKVIPEKFLKPTDTNMIWPEYRKILIKEGIKDPEFPKNPSYCKYGDSTEVPTKSLN